MVLILIAIIALIVLSAISAERAQYVSFFELISQIFVVVGFVLLGVYAVVSWEYLAAEYKVDIVNREYGTEYTQLEMFYASDVIETVRELDRKRIEINGDLITGDLITGDLITGEK